MAPRLEPGSRRLLTAFSANLNRLDPQPLDWQRFYDFILYAFGHEPPSAEAVGHALVQKGLDWDEAEPFMLFYRHAVELLLRQATLARKARPRDNGSGSRRAHQAEARWARRRHGLEGRDS